jgi:CelD/BcsL family acetyltransferase involved in cellulose biosynthesis
MTYDWFRIWSKRSVQENRKGHFRPHVLVLKEDETVVGIVPLVRHQSSFRHLRMRRLEFSTSHADYNDVVLGRDTAGQTMVMLEFLARTPEQWDLVELRDLRDTGDTIAHIKDALARTDLIYRLFPENGRCPQMSIDGSWPEILSRRSSATRHTFRNQQSRLNRMISDGLRVRIIDCPQEEPGLLDKMIAVEAQKRVSGKSLIPVLGYYPDAFRSMFETLGPKGWLCIAAVELKDRLLAWQLLFRCGEKLWGYLTAYDNEFSRLSPSSMLMPAVVDYGFSCGYTEYDFLRGEEPYKLRWATGFHQTYRLLIWNRRWMSRLRANAYLRFRVRNSMSAMAEPRVESV